MLVFTGIFLDTDNAGIYWYFPRYWPDDWQWDTLMTTTTRVFAATGTPCPFRCS